MRKRPYKRIENSFGAPSPDTKKVCFKCGVKYPLADFTNRAGNLRKVCKGCWQKGSEARKARPKSPLASSVSTRASAVKIINTKTGEVTEQPAYNLKERQAIIKRHGNSRHVD